MVALLFVVLLLLLLLFVRLLVGWLVCLLLSAWRHSVFHISGTNVAGAVHLSPAQQRTACGAIAPLSARLADAFPGCVAGGTSACDCPSESYLATTVASAEFAFRVAAWFVASGASAEYGSWNCGDMIAGVVSDGLGAPRTASTAPSGFYRMAECLRAGGPSGPADAGLAQRVSHFQAAMNFLAQPITVTLSPSNLVVTALPATFTATFSQGVHGALVNQSTALSLPSGMEVTAWAPTNKAAEFSNGFEFDVNAAGLSHGVFSLSVLAGAAVTDTGMTNAAVSNASLTYIDGTSECPAYARCTWPLIPHDSLAPFEQSPCCCV